MAATASALKSRAVKILIRPVPSTLSDSLAILAHLRSFGEVTSFFNPHYAPSLHNRQSDSASGLHPDKQKRESIICRAIFSSSTSITSALSNPTSQIESGTDALDPHQDDPFDVRDLKHRVPPPKRTFTIRIEPDDEADQYHTAKIKSNPFTTSFQPERLQPVAQSLLLSDIPHPSLASTPSTTYPPHPRSATDEIPLLTPESQSLRTLHRNAVRKRAQGQLPPPPPPPSQEELRQNPKLRTPGQLSRLEAFRRDKLRQRENRDRRLDVADRARREAEEMYAKIWDREQNVRWPTTKDRPDDEGGFDGEGNRMWNERDRAGGR